MKKFLGCVVVAASLVFVGVAGTAAAADRAQSERNQAFLAGLAQPPAAVGVEAQKAKPADACTQTFCSNNEDCENTTVCGYGTFCHRTALWGKCDYF